MGRVYADTGITTTFGGTGVTSQGNLHTREYITFGTAVNPELAVVTFGTGGFSWEYNGFNWHNYNEANTYKVTAVDGTIVFDINDVGDTSLIRIMNGSGTIGEIDSSGNMKLAGTLGTGVSF